MTHADLVATLRLSDPALRDQLVEDLRSRPELSVAPISEDTIEVDVVGSVSADAMRLAIQLRVLAWEAAQRAAGRTVHVELSI